MIHYHIRALWIALAASGVYESFARNQMQKRISDLETKLAIVEASTFNLETDKLNRLTETWRTLPPCRNGKGQHIHDQTCIFGVGEPRQEGRK